MQVPVRDSPFGKPVHLSDSDLFCEGAAEATVSQGAREVWQFFENFAQNAQQWAVSPSNCSFPCSHPVLNLSAGQVEGSCLSQGAKFQISYSLMSGGRGATTRHECVYEVLEANFGKRVKFSVEDFDMDSLYTTCPMPRQPNGGLKGMRTFTLDLSEQVDGSTTVRCTHHLRFVANTGHQMWWEYVRDFGCHPYVACVLGNLVFWGMPLCFAAPCCETAQRNYEKACRQFSQSQSAGLIQSFKFAMQGHGGGTTQAPARGLPLGPSLQLMERAPVAFCSHCGAKAAGTFCSTCGQELTRSA